MYIYTIDILFYVYDIYTHRHTLTGVIAANGIRKRLELFQR